MSDKLITDLKEAYAQVYLNEQELFYNFTKEILVSEGYSDTDEEIRELMLDEGWKSVLDDFVKGWTRRGAYSTAQTALRKTKRNLRKKVDGVTQSSVDKAEDAVKAAKPVNQSGSERFGAAVRQTFGRSAPGTPAIPLTGGTVRPVGIKRGLIGIDVAGTAIGDEEGNRGPSVTADVIGNVVGGAGNVIKSVGDTTGWKSFSNFGRATKGTGKRITNLNRGKGNVDFDVPDGYEAYVDDNGNVKLRKK